ncbi:hypothetical protein GCK72_004535 [Caenorhabditis remanei]|uniref:Uncharacterized protein n=1 Tax=Caenorhabditis remanei TaxID=31234 RepID=A0A6A5HCN6_CAERE|nr:hypothetical protein GCK72_004535 [Caenorhabditis remanei]KAF1764586.1 hypothetical protein GCK72_004535 [Caenorhabditis remanei]
MQRKPLAYDSLKTVIQHMGPEIRFELTRCVPQIRLTEAVVPLKIHFLELGMNSTKINGTTYEMRTYHEYDQGATVPKYIRNRNKNGGLRVDYDQFGHRDDSFRNVLTTGDLDFRDGRELPAEGRMREVVVNGLEVLSEIMKKSIERRENQVERSEEDNRQIEELLNSCTHVRAANDKEIRALLFIREVKTLFSLSFESLRMALDEVTSLMQPYIFERHNQPTPWRNVIRLSITSKNKNQKIHQLPFNCRLHEAVKILNKLLVCRGNPLVNVNTLNISNSYYILRMPVNFKLKIKNLDGEVRNSFYEALSGIIHESSYPLNRVYVNCISDSVNVLDHPLIRDAKTLNVTAVTLPRQQRLPLLLKMQNPTILVDSLGFLETNGMIALIRNLKESSRPIGHKIRLNTLGFNTAFETLKEIANQFNGTRIRGRKIKIPINDASTLQVSYLPKHIDSGNEDFYLEIVVVSDNN